MSRLPNINWQVEDRIAVWPVSPYVQTTEEPVNSTSKKPNNVTNPAHYHAHAFEPIRVIVENKLSWCLGNVFKYISRYDLKNGLEDLKKARRYLDMEIARLEGNEDWWRLPE